MRGYVISILIDIKSSFHWITWLDSEPLVAQQYISTRSDS